MKSVERRMVVRKVEKVVIEVGEEREGQRVGKKA